MYRFWDGGSWSASLSPTPGAAPPMSQSGLPRQGSAAPYAPGRPTTPITPRKRSWGWIIGLLAVLVALVVVIVLVVQRVGGGLATPLTPGGQPSGDVCPQPRTESPQPQPGDGRVHGGRLSYPLLGSPWSAPQPEDKVAFGRGVLIQSVEIEKSGAQRWLAAVLIGELVAGDGFFAPEDGAAIVVKCVSGTFYGDSEVTRDDKVNKSTTVDGHDAWVIESQLGFDVPGIKAKSELLIVVIVETGNGSAGLFYASIPENAPELIAPARRALASVHVDD